VRFYQVETGEPKLLGVLGTEGGIRAGIPGVVEPEKLMRPAGANFDTAAIPHASGAKHIGRNDLV